ncbi:MAG: hypothetical protein OEV74_16660 [Cyclobacteriaceae bacterium]|nr:hypothetical protein [Cyclobacteriaceae bacterium]MDH4297912.1 hypothetical protein [Cyclobacteriaceae bacterium]MDH5250266.1 hypothetical protein [Cyclobacteriaceae bacterium]
MKQNLLIFAVMFVGNFTLLYFFSSDRDIAGMLFVSAGTAVVIALMNKYLKKYAVSVIKRIVKPRE